MKHIDVTNGHMSIYKHSKGSSSYIYMEHPYRSKTILMKISIWKNSIYKNVTDILWPVSTKTTSYNLVQHCRMMLALLVQSAQRPKACSNANIVWHCWVNFVGFVWACLKATEAPTNKFPTCNCSQNRPL